MSEHIADPDQVPAAPSTEEGAASTGAAPTTDQPEDGTATAAAEAAGDGTAHDEEKRKRRRKLVLLWLLLLLLLGVVLLGVWYAIYRKPITEVFPPITQEMAPHYVFSMYGVTQPLGIAVTPDGSRVYVAETGGDKLVKIIDAKGNPIGALKPPQDNLPHQPVYVTVDPQSLEVYVSDRITGAVYICDQTGKYARKFEPKAKIDVWQPLDVAFASDGSLWITDVSSPFHRVEVFDRQGTLLRTIGQAGQFSFPNGVAVSAGGDVYVADSNNGRLVVMDQQGNSIATIGRGTAVGTLGLPRGVAVDDAGRLYVVDTTGHTVHRYRTRLNGDPRPSFLDDMGIPGTGDGQFQYPSGVAVDARGHVYVTDRDNNRVQMWSY